MLSTLGSIASSVKDLSKLIHLFNFQNSLKDEITGVTLRTVPASLTYATSPWSGFGSCLCLNTATTTSMGTIDIADISASNLKLNSPMAIEFMFKTQGGTVNASKLGFQLYSDVGDIQFEFSWSYEYEYTSSTYVHMAYFKYRSDGSNSIISYQLNTLFTPYDAQKQIKILFKGTYIEIYANNVLKFTTPSNINQGIYSINKLKLISRSASSTGGLGAMYMDSLAIFKSNELRSIPTSPYI